VRKLGYPEDHRRSKFKLDVDIEIKEIGLQPGETLHEELITHLTRLA